MLFLAPWKRLARARELRERERAMRQVQSLSAREREIFLLLCEGRLGKQIAHDLNVSEATVKVHAQSVYRKLGARNRTHAAIIAREQGFG